MVRTANTLLLVFAVAPVVYLAMASIVTSGKGSIARDSNIVPPLFFGLVIVSVLTIGTMAYVQTSESIMPERGRYDPLGRVFSKMSTGVVLSEALAIYGLVITLLSGEILYVVGFSLVTWACLWWVREKFKQNLGKLPTA